MYCKSAHASFCKPALTFWELRTIFTEERYKNVYCDVVLLVMEAGNKRAMEILRATEREMWRSCEWQQAFKLARQLICDIYQGMWTFALTCFVDCIRLLAGGWMNICHKVLLSTVMQPHTAYSKHKELLQSCYWKLKVNPTYGADLAHWNIIFVPVTQHLGGHQLYSKKNAGAYFLPWQL